jgi:hypothetical protein
MGLRPPCGPGPSRGLDHAAEFPIHEQAIVDGAGSRLELADGHAKPGTEVHFGLGLNQPSARDKPPVDQRPGLVLGMEGGIVHEQLLGEPFAIVTVP